jgi:hypothetical protein
MYKNDLFHIQQQCFGLYDGLTKCVCVAMCTYVRMHVCKHFKSPQ